MNQPTNALQPPMTPEQIQEQEAIQAWIDLRQRGPVCWGWDRSSGDDLSVEVEMAADRSITRVTYTPPRLVPFIRPASVPPASSADTTT